VWHAFQVCYELTDLNRSREISGFNVIEPLLNIASKTIITYNQKERVDDVEIVPFYEWVFNA
jgi:hypothetical protein